MLESSVAALLSSFCFWVEVEKCNKPSSVLASHGTEVQVTLCHRHVMGNREGRISWLNLNLYLDFLEQESLIPALGFSLAPAVESEVAMDLLQCFFALDVWCLCHVLQCVKEGKWVN